MVGLMADVLYAESSPANSVAVWPFTPLPDLNPPVVKNADRVANGIDNFILARLEEKGLTLAPPASARTLVRRVYFDLIGLPPTAAEVDAFVNDPDPKAYAKLVDKLLADPRYGERWARFWLDLARYADTAGYEGDPDLICQTPGVIGTTSSTPSIRTSHTTISSSTKSRVMKPWTSWERATCRRRSPSRPSR